LAVAGAIVDHIDVMIEDAFGNYLVQNVLLLNSVQKNEQIFDYIASDFVRLS